MGYSETHSVATQESVEQRVGIPDDQSRSAVETKDDVTPASSRDVQSRQDDRSEPLRREMIQHSGLKDIGEIGEA